MPCRSARTGRTLLAHQIGDTMTDAAVRHIGRGPTSILGRTALHFYERFCEGQVAFNYGFNVANIQKFSLRFLRSDRVEPVTYRVASAAAADRRARSAGCADISSSSCARHDAEWDELFERVRGDYRFLVRRDAAYVRWRYLARARTSRTSSSPSASGGSSSAGSSSASARTASPGATRSSIRDFPDAVEVALRHVVPSYPVDVDRRMVPAAPAVVRRHRSRDLGFETAPEPQDLSRDVRAVHVAGRDRADA